MRDRLIYLLKHSGRVQKLYIVFMSFIIGVYGKFISLDNDLVLFVSFMGKGFDDSPKAIYEYMRSHAEYNQYRCVWAFEHPEKYPELETIKIDSMNYFKIALRARFWITNTNIERGLHFKKKNQKYLNTWHGIALKHIGNDCPGRKDYNFDAVDYLVVSGEYDERVFRSAFRAREKSFLKCGMPRNEELWLADDAKKTAVRQKLGIPKDKKVILYVPTWRDSDDGGRSYSIKPPIDFTKLQKKVGGEYLVLFRAHHQTTKVQGITYSDFVINVSKYPMVNDLMIAADILVTDYSAIAFDYSILCRPIICYAYDYDSYLAKRGTYFDIDDYYPNKSCRTEKELVEKIINLNYEDECQNTKKFRDRFIQYGLGATEACTRAMFENLKH